MALMKKLYTLNETRELMDYFGDLVAWDAIMELFVRSSELPSSDWFIVSKGADLKVVEKPHLLEHIVQKWHVELDTITLIENGIVQNPQTTETK